MCRNKSICLPSSSLLLFTHFFIAYLLLDESWAVRKVVGLKCSLSVKILLGITFQGWAELIQPLRAVTQSSLDSRNIGSGLGGVGAGHLKSGNVDAGEFFSFELLISFDNWKTNFVGQKERKGEKVKPHFSWIFIMFSFFWKVTLSIGGPSAQIS